MAQTADYLSCSKQKVRQIINEKKLEATQIGSGKNSPWRITSVSIEKPVKANRNK